jgi:hypothetical protein
MGKTRKSKLTIVDFKVVPYPLRSLQSGIYRPIRSIDLAFGRQPVFSQLGLVILGLIR